MITIGPEQGGEFRFATDEYGNQLGYFSLETPEDGNIFFSQVVVFEPRKGTGTAIYKAVGREVSEKGLTLVSDPDSFSYGAYLLWQSLERSGDAVLLSDVKEAYIDDRGDVYGVRYRLNDGT